MKIKISTVFLLLTIIIVQLIPRTASQNPDPLNPLPNTESTLSASTTAAQTTTIDPTKPSTIVTPSDTSTASTPATTPDSSTSQPTLQPSIPESSTTIPSSSSQITTPLSTPSSSLHTSSSISSTTTQPKSSSKSVTSSVTSTTSTPSPNHSDPINTTPIIVGSVVGGVAAIALIVGLLAFISRRGGCTKRADRNKKSNFDDYGLADFPTHRNPTQEANSNAVHNHISPTIPRLNEQGNYYNGDYNNYNHQDEYTMHSQQHGGYYYPQQNHQQGYYEDGGYYYEGSPGVTSSGSYAPQSHNQQTYAPQEYSTENNTSYTNTPQNVYKPDDIASKGAEKK